MGLVFLMHPSKQSLHACLCKPLDWQTWSLARIYTAMVGLVNRMTSDMYELNDLVAT